MLRYNLDFRVLRHFGLSLNTNKKYFVVCCPMMWVVEGVYDDLELALKHIHMSVDEYNEICRDTEDMVGHCWDVGKGFFHNLCVWDLLDLLRELITDKYNKDLFKDDNKNRLMSAASDYALSRIHPNMHAYPEYIEDEICNFAKFD